LKKLSWVAIVGLLILLLLTLQLASDTILNPQSAGATYYTLLLKVNALGLFILIVVIGINLVQLLIKLRRNEPGAKLTSRMLGIFTVLAITPVLIVFYYSLQFLYKGIDNWFDTEIESALHDSLDLSRASLKIRERDLTRKTRQMLVDIRQEETTLLAVSLDKIRAANQADELTLMRQDGTIIATSSTDSAIIPERLTQNMLFSLQQGTDVAILEPLKEDQLYLRVVVTEATSALLLQALYPIPERLVSLGDSVEEALEKHGRLSYMREHIKTNFTWTLSSVLMFSLFAAILAAFVSAQRLVAPIQELAQGTAAIAAGNYEQKIEFQRKDDLGFLVISFNQMSENIAQARDAAARSQRLVEDQRAYLQSILSGLSSGVLTFDPKGQLITANPAAGDILKVDFAPLLNQSEQALMADLRLALFFPPILQRINTHKSEWREEICLPAAGNKQILFCRGTPLVSAGGEVTGYVVVLEDVTQLIQAQRDAAWGEVARRLAHEIKNPLTPIQLSAERLRHKYLKTMAEKDAKVLDRATSTIIAQVGTLKEMVDAFAAYAKKPEIKKTQLDINQVVSEAAEFYQTQQHGALEMCLGENIPVILADSGRLRQIMNNLLKNAFEAIEERTEGRIIVRTTYLEHEPCINLAIEDNGPGFSDAVHGHVFEPYKTTKLKGTGLGLAIVKKIVEEHGGDIDAENTTSGACVTIHLPIMNTTLSAKV